MHTMSRLGVFAALCLSLASCSLFGKDSTTTSSDGGTTDGGASDAGSTPQCASPCGSNCCTSGQVCDQNSKTCVANCLPQCMNKQCGDDGCGGKCGTCLAGTSCDSQTGTCRPCAADCNGKQCGSDGCGGQCGMCGSNQTCSSSGQCMTQACVPQCAGKACGDDGCGGTCAPGCGPGQTCNAGVCEACPSNCVAGASACDSTCKGSCGVCTDPTQECSAAGVCVCKRQCTGRTCGPDGCGGECGTCATGSTCDETGKCVCQPNCNGKVCGPDGCGGSCGPCAGGQTCDASGQCVTGCMPNCTGKNCGSNGCGGQCGTCSTGQTCNSSGQCVTSCMPNCNGKVCGSNGCGGSCGSCGTGKSCNTSGQCVTNTGSTCNGVTCATGQGCYNPQTGASAGSGLTCTCLPEYNDANGVYHADTCANQGMVCDYTGSASTCRIPQEKELCQPSVGCSAGFDCVSLNGDNVCLKKCTANTQCTALYDFCDTAVSGGYCHRSTCTNYFGTCNANGTGDGTCVPFDTVDASGTLVAFGVCMLGGTSGGVCDPNATRATSASSICPKFQRCDPTSPTTGVCRGLCNSAPSPNPAQACAGGQVCTDLSDAQDDTELVNVRQGFCYTSCSLFGTDVCPTTAAGDRQSCYYYDGSSTGRCYPRVASPPAAGGTCTRPNSASSDYKLPCGDRQFCLTAQGTDTGTCAGFCDTSVCTSTTTSCATCQPSGKICNPFQGVQAGYCN